MFQISYEAEFECPKGHRFLANANPLKSDGVARCPHCLEAWIAANVPDGKQVSEATQKVPKDQQF
jgi:hypothetical protein